MPDLETICNAYIIHCRVCEENPDEIQNHEFYICPLLEQSVRKEASGTSQQGRFRRLIENFILGDARRRGETHQWMYDRFNFKAKLVTAGYKEVHIQRYNTSLISNWDRYGLDIDRKGNQYKPDSLYVEAVK